MIFEKKLYKLLKSKLFLGLSLTLIIAFGPMTINNASAQCEEVDFTIQLELVRGVCVSGERAVLTLSVNDGMSGGDAFGYEWNDGINSGEIESGVEIEIIDIDASPNYCITVTRFEEEGCVHTACIEVPTVTTLDCVLEVTNNVGCGGEPTGELTATVTGGEGNYVYQWQGEAIACSEGAVSDVTAEFGASITGLAPGKYSLTVTDATGCSSNQKVCSIEICKPAGVTVDLQSTQPDCESGATNGSISATGSGGTNEFSYAWTGPGGYTAAKAAIENLSPGIYNLVLTDANGCTIGFETELLQPVCEQEPPTDECDCELEANGVDLFDVPVYKLVKKKKKKRYRGRKRCYYVYETVQIGTQKVRFLGSEYHAECDATEFKYRVSSCETPNVRNVIFGNVGRRFQGCFSPGNVWSASGAECVYWKRSDRTGISGVKYDHICWHENDCESGNRTADVSFTMPGEVGTTSTSGFSFGVRSGRRGYGRVEVPGPDCNTFECPNGSDRMMQEVTTNQITIDRESVRATQIGRTVNGGAEITPTPTNETSVVILESEEERIDPIMDVYPNPFVAGVNVIIDQPIAETITLEVLDASGKLIHSRPINEGYSAERVDLADQPQGVYFIRVKGEGVDQTMHKVVKK